MKKLLGALGAEWLLPLEHMAMPKYAVVAFTRCHAGLFCAGYTMPILQRLTLTDVKSMLLLLRSALTHVEAQGMACYEQRLEVT